MKQVTMILLFALLLMGPAWAQAQPEPVPEAIGDVQNFLPALTAAEVEMLIALASERRLTLERQQVIAELRQDLLFDPEQVDAAVAYLEGNPASTREQSVQNIYEALALVDLDFEVAMQQRTNGEFAEAAETVAKDISANEATYLAAARQLFHADVLREAGEDYPAMDAYDALLKNMSERMSFAATATLHAAELSRGRKEYIEAMNYYAKGLKDYGLTLTEAEYAEGLEFIKKYKAIYENPMGSISGMMNEVQQRLDAEDTGEETQAIQKEIVAIIEDLVATNPQSPNQPPPPPGSQPPEDGEEEPQPGESQSQPQRTARATNPATDSALNDKGDEKAMDRSQSHTGEESGDWASLPPREREKLQELAQRDTDERYRKLAVDYHKKLAEGDDE
jgi:hypothetical protein